MQNVLSSHSRVDRVVADIVHDFSCKPRLSNERGTAILVAASIFDACRYFERFQTTPFKGKCAIVTSYNPQARDVTTEETGANTQTDKQFIYDSNTELLTGVAARPGRTQIETYEDNAKRLFKDEPANMKLLVVVDKLLTGFDAPSCTYLYIDKSMRDHGLFQAICHTNRLNGEDKEFGYIVGYKDLFNRVENAIAVYTSELDQGEGEANPQVLLQDRLAKGRERLEAAREVIALICEPVEPPRRELEHIPCFCGNSEVAGDLKEHEPQRVALYKATAGLFRAHANIVEELDKADYSAGEINVIDEELKHYRSIREAVRNAAGETLDLKAYEADMRHLLDTYIDARLPRTVSPFGNMPLLESIVKSGIAEAVNSLPDGVKGNEEAVAEVIQINVRSTIIKEEISDPAYYARMSALLDEIIAARRARAIDYHEYLRRIAALASQVERPDHAGVPASINTAGWRALYNNLGENADLAMAVDQIIRETRQSDWRGNQARERMIMQALLPILDDDIGEVERLFPIVVAQTEY